MWLSVLVVGGRALQTAVGSAAAGFFAVGGGRFFSRRGGGGLVGRCCPVVRPFRGSRNTGNEGSGHTGPHSYSDLGVR